MSFDALISNSESLRIRQRHELAELFGFETRNKYSIENESGQPVGYVAEQGKGLFGLLWRGFLGHWRSFRIIVFDIDRKPILNLHHPFRFYFQRLEVRAQDNRLLGVVEKRFSIFSKKFEIMNEQGQVFLIVNSPFWRFWTFVFKNGDIEYARIEKKWSGFFSEVATDRDNFMIYFTRGITTIEQRYLLLASGLFIDILYFERNARQ